MKSIESIDKAAKSIDAFDSINYGVYSRCPPQYCEVRLSSLTAEIGLGVWAPQQISTGFASLLCYCSDVTHWRPTKPCTTFGRLLAGTLFIHFRGLLPLTEFCQVQNSLCVPILRSPILATLLYGTRTAGVSQNLRHATRNGIAELSQTAPPIFGRAAITLGIGPHSSCI